MAKWARKWLKRRYIYNAEVFPLYILFSVSRCLYVWMPTARNSIIMFSSSSRYFLVIVYYTDRIMATESFCSLLSLESWKLSFKKDAIKVRMCSFIVCIYACHYMLNVYIYRGMYVCVRACMCACTYEGDETDIDHLYIYTEQLCKFCVNCSLSRTQVTVIVTYVDWTHSPVSVLDETGVYFTLRDQTWTTLVSNCDHGEHFHCMANYTRCSQRTQVTTMVKDVCTTLTALYHRHVLVHATVV